MKKIAFTIHIIVLLMLSVKLSAQTVSDSITYITYQTKIPHLSHFAWQSPMHSMNYLDISHSLPKVTYRFYDTNSYFTQGRFAAMPFNEWGPYQAPFHMTQQKIMIVEPKR